MEYIKLHKVNLKTHRIINEQWVQDRIAEDPSILGLGDIVLRDKERKQPRAGRLDFLFEDEEKKRYVVELQLGKTDESHIIRTIEYWDIEKKRYPNHEHVAVIIAEDITSRFLNVISLFNRSMPIIAIQMNAVEIDGKIGLHFTTVLDETPLQQIDEEEDEQISVDRTFWEDKASKETIVLVDEMLKILNDKVDSSIELKYTKFYIGLGKNGRVGNFVKFKPRKRFVVVDITLLETEDIDNLLEESGLDYEKRYRCYRLRINKSEIKQNEELLGNLFSWGNDYYNG